MTFPGRQPWAICFALYLGFQILYLAAGLSLAKTSAFSEYDLLFDTDVPRVVADMTSLHADHDRTHVHPYFVLLVKPLGLALTNVLRSDVRSALFLNSFFGAVGVVLAFLFFRLAGRASPDAILIACLFGFTSSQFLLSSIPDTASLAVCSLLATYLVFLFSLRDHRTTAKPWILTGVFSLGVTISNFTQTALCFGVHEAVNWRIGRRDRLARRVLTFFLATGVTAVLLSLVQKLLFPTCRLFFRLLFFREEVAYTSASAITSPLLVLGRLLRSVFLNAVTAPHPAVRSIPQREHPLLGFATSWSYGWIGWLALAGWVALAAVGGIRGLRQREQLPLKVGLSLCLLFNILLHCFYGGAGRGPAEYFLYTGNTTFLVIALLVGIPLRGGTLSRVMLGILVLLVAANSAGVLLDVRDVYR